MIVYLSLGSNLHPRHHYIDEACQQIEERCGEILHRSHDFYSMPQGYESNHEYLNICLKLRTDLSPIALLRLTQQIERELGRTVKNHYQDRTIDIDLIQAFDKQGQEIKVATNDLTLPHEKMQEREFVMIPLKECKD